ncbi:245_t:CDS:2 [Paraglomus brasilianum]|uniref:245_t:CDS:1 n=1 Tax=Paraglomus brasilianum TaxID=144538 RepID=A0A9N9GNI9_9GLOM|nr:245_t:CDS:2 [Paraglomus brasilianum]
MKSIRNDTEWDAIYSTDTIPLLITERCSSTLLSVDEFSERRNRSTRVPPLGHGDSGQPNLEINV